MDQPTIICLTPIRNEAWILDRFLRCASCWADLIILADQGSTDDSVAIARTFPKVRVIANSGQNYDEFARQELLIRTARELVPGPRLLLALDADEVFTANYAASAEWTKMLQSPPGTVFRFRWVNLCPDLRRAWLSRPSFAWGFMDNGAPHSGKDIHSVRVPVPDGSPQVVCEEIRALHYQFTDPGRMQSKHRWYQCFERVRRPDVSAVKIFDKYHHVDRVKAEEFVAIKPEWLRSYQEQGIDMLSVHKPADGLYWWDPLLADMMAHHGTAFFARENIWEEWPPVAKKLGVDPSLYADPRTPFQKRVHRFLSSPSSLAERFFAQLLKRVLRQIGY